VLIWQVVRIGFWGIPKLAVIQRSRRLTASYPPSNVVDLTICTPARNSKRRPGLYLVVACSHRPSAALVQVANAAMLRFAGIIPRKNILGCLYNMRWRNDLRSILDQE
jgi:hypothetical protein